MHLSHLLLIFINFPKLTAGRKKKSEFSQLKTNKQKILKTHNRPRAITILEHILELDKIFKLILCRSLPPLNFPQKVAITQYKNHFSSLTKRMEGAG